MPTRILREGIITSENVNALSDGAEIFYRRLMSIVDDYGRYYGHASLLRAACYPLKLDTVSEAHVKRHMQECVKAGLIVVYNDGKHLFLTNFKQQTRAPSKFPQPSESELLSKCEADSHRMRSESESESESNAESGEMNSPQQSDAEFLESLKSSDAYAGIDVPKEFAKMSAWCQVNGKKPSRRRFVNWLNRCEKPLVGILSGSVNRGPNI